MKNFLFLFILLSMSFAGQAQTTGNHIQWSYEVKKSAKGRYSLIFHATLDKGWHLFSQKPGGDGMLIPPSFEFPAKVKRVGAVTESGKLITTTMEGIDGRVSFYENRVDFTQEVTGKAGQSIQVTHEFQICSETTCLPPKKGTHTFTLSP